MATLRIQLFGTVQVTHDGRASDGRLIHAVQSLLAWLLLNRRKTHARETLAGLFWGEQTESRARSCLSTALWRLRLVLEPEGIPRGTYLVTRPAVVGFNCESDYWLDVAAFEEGVGRGSEEAVACYTGDLLEGFYEDWALRERERLRMLYLDCLGRLLRRHSESGALERALDCGRQILALDPLREDIHREVIRLLVRNGQRALALQQYESCRAALEAELGVEPMEETRALCADLLKARGKPIPGKAMARIAPALRAAAAKLDEARDALADALRIAETETSENK
jgi:DNA-binding SARP family transcriptional activator